MTCFPRDPIHFLSSQKERETRISWTRHLVSSGFNRGRPFSFLPPPPPSLKFPLYVSFLDACPIPHFVESQRSRSSY